uniref:K Homology domain-containing protein n=1 Tax=Monopterus albus TaxID=43700 RepID=A0A3Q3J843_MONAL
MNERKTKISHLLNPTEAPHKQTTAGLIIGKGGATVKAVMEQSGAWVQLSQKPEGINLQERVVTISGEPEQNRKAVEIIVQKIQEDPQKKLAEGAKEVVEIAVPENLVGAILGKGGKTLVEYQELTGARIQISKKGEFIPGTRNRKVTITGSQAATQAAQYLITTLTPRSPCSPYPSPSHGSFFFFSTFDLPLNPISSPPPPAVPTPPFKRVL